MSGFDIEMTITDKAVLENFSKLERSMKDTTPVMSAIGTGLVASMTRRFVSQTGPDGAPWAALNPGYAAGKKNTRILTESGRLRGSLTFNAGKDSVNAGTNVIYAAIHNFGGTISAKGGGRLAFFIGGRMVRPTSVTIPARPFAGISAEDEVMISDTVTGFVKRHLP